MEPTPECNVTVSNSHYYVASNCETVNGYFTSESVNGTHHNLNLFSTPGIFQRA